MVYFILDIFLDTFLDTFFGQIFLCPYIDLYSNILSTQTIRFCVAMLALVLIGRLCWSPPQPSDSRSAPGYSLLCLLVTPPMFTVTNLIIPVFIAINLIFERPIMESIQRFSMSRRYIESFQYKKFFNKNT